MHDRWNSTIAWPLAPCLHLSSIVGQLQRLDNGSNIAIYHSWQIMHCVAKAVVCYPPMRIVVRTDLVSPVAALEHGLALCSHGSLLLFELSLVKPRPQDLHRFIEVFDL